MSDKFWSTVLLLLAVLFAVILFARKTEYFQSIDASLTVIPPPTGSKALSSIHVDVSGDGFPVSISNLGDLTSAVQTQAQGGAADSMPSPSPSASDLSTSAASASQLQTNMDTMAELRRILRNQKQNARMFDSSAMSGDDDDGGDDDGNGDNSKSCGSY
jgi:hypothetical protein